MIVADLIETLETIAPTRCAEEWDNVGLLVGDCEKHLAGPTLLTIDFTENVLAEARNLNAGMILAYHPPIFQALNRVTADHPKSRTLLGAIEAGMAIYSPHTALDAAPGGLTDWLCDMLAPDDDLAKSQSFSDRAALSPFAALDPRQTHKLIVFVPEDHLDRLREALASVGAGVIGEYKLCSFNLPGRGTFFGSDAAAPTVGATGKLETVPEVRLEMVCPGAALGLVREILKQFHPYEEPAWDAYPLAAKPDRSVGAGRRLHLDQPATPMELAQRLKRHLGVDAVKVALAFDEPIERVGVCPGAGASLLKPALAEGCGAFVTGEMRHHEAIEAVARGCSVILAGHTNTERGFLPTYARRINKLAPSADARVSAADQTLFKTI